MSRLLASCLSTLLLAVLAPMAQAAPVTLEQATTDLDMLEDMLDSRDATHDDIKAWMLVAADNYKAVEGDARKVEDFREDVIDQILEALRETDIQDQRNERESVNIKAAEVLKDLGPILAPKVKKRLWKKIRRVINRLHDAKRYEPGIARIEATFTALAHTGEHDALRWLLDDYVHAKKNEVHFLIAAHKAMQLFKNVPGSLRYEIVDEFIDRYAGIEALAVQSSADPAIVSKKVFWDKIRVHTIATIQYYAGFPKTEDGVAINTMQGFQKWFRGVKNVRRAPWKDETPAN
jgi:hypothetical protein